MTIVTVITNIHISIKCMYNNVVEVCETIMTASDMIPADISNYDAG